ncbi:MAG: hypothetical protein ACXVB1_17575 [Pseudobdellovibrionaceae bacterium]
MAQLSHYETLQGTGPLQIGNEFPTYPDMYDGHVEAASVTALLASSNVIEAKNNAGSFKLDQTTSTLTVSNEYGRKINEKVTCKHYED